MSKPFLLPRDEMDLPINCNPISIEQWTQQICNYTITLLLLTAGEPLNPIYVSALGRSDPQLQAMLTVYTG